MVKKKTVNKVKPLPVVDLTPQFEAPVLPAAIAEKHLPVETVDLPDLKDAKMPEKLREVIENKHVKARVLVGFVDGNLRHDFFILGYENFWRAQEVRSITRDLYSKCESSGALLEIVND